jgi:DNA polymerase-4
MRYRKILHLDLDAFFCSVEELLHPELKGKAFAVGGSPEGRGVVSSCSYAARQFGVRSAMPMGRALRLCPELQVVPSHFGAYHEYSQRVMKVLQDQTPLVEQLSIDEAFLDLSDLPQEPIDLAKSIQQKINHVVHLPCSLGVLVINWLPKLLITSVKIAPCAQPPNAITVVAAGGEAAFLAPLPVKEMWGIGPKTAERLTRAGIHTLDDVCHASPEILTKLLGKFGAELRLHAQGMDDRPVEVGHETKSVSQEITFERDVCDRQRLIDTLRDLSEQVGYHLRREGFCAQTVRIKLRWSDFTTITRQTTLSEAVDQDGEIFAAACALFEGAWQPGEPVRLIGVGTSKLTSGAQQLSLWNTHSQKERRLLTAMDELRERYGRPWCKGQGLCTRKNDAKDS